MPRPLTAEAYHVDGDASRAETLPPEAFTDASFLDLELATLYARAWLAVPLRDARELRDDGRSLADLVRRRGARAPFTLHDRPLFLQRDWDGTLRAFPNVCTHAWHTLVQGPDRDRRITCPQHGRQFDCAGRYQTQPGFEKADGMPRDADHLHAFPVEEWMALLFVALGEPAAPFDAALAPVRESLARLPLDALRRRPLAGEVRELAGNWKQHAWNFMDRLHIPFIHRKPGGLADALDLGSYRTELHPWAALQWAFAKDPAAGFDPAWLPERFARDGKRVFALWWLVLPNLALNFYPWGLSINLFSPVPGAPLQTLFQWYHYTWDDAKYARRDDVWMMREVDDEDVDALSQVARGAVSGFAPRGRFVPGEEDGPHWLHRRVFEEVFGTGRPGKDLGKG